MFSYHKINIFKRNSQINLNKIKFKMISSVNLGKKRKNNKELNKDRKLF